MWMKILNNYAVSIGSTTFYVFLHDYPLNANIRKMMISYPSASFMKQYLVKDEYAK